MAAQSGATVYHQVRQAGQSASHYVLKPHAKVSVCVRMRPFTDDEKICPLKQVLCNGDKILVKEHDNQRNRYSGKSADGLEFQVDFVQDDSYLPVLDRDRKEESQKRMYNALGAPCVEFALQGINTTILAYGQIGSGKTYTMTGDGTKSGRGIMPRLTCELIHRVNERRTHEFCRIEVSYLEIYQEKVRDLLGTKSSGPEDGLPTAGEECLPSDVESEQGAIFKDNFSVDGEANRRSALLPPFSLCSTKPARRREFLRVREHPVTGPYVEGLVWKEVCTWDEMERLLLAGAANRTIDKDKYSIRSHTLFTIRLTRGPIGDQSCAAQYTVINLVDLAGSEKLQNNCSCKVEEKNLEQDQDWKYINQSLSQLHEVGILLSLSISPKQNSAKRRLFKVILSLSRNTYTSYRNCALTWLLRESLGQNSRTFLLATISPAEQDFQESLNTLRYSTKANRLCGTYTTTSLGSDPRKKLMYKMKEEIDTLQSLVQSLTTRKTGTKIEPPLRLLSYH